MADHAVSNSYIATTELADAYFANDPRASAIAFLLLTTDQKAWYLSRATRVIDQLPFIGVKSTSTQTLEHPRKILVNPETDSPYGDEIESDSYGYKLDEEVPDVVENATCEEALALYEFYVTYTGDQKRQRLQSQGVKSISLGDMSESYGSSSSSKPTAMKSTEAYQMLIDSGYVELAPLIQ